MRVQPKRLLGEIVYKAKCENGLKRHGASYFEASSRTNEVLRDRLTKQFQKSYFQICNFRFELKSELGLTNAERGGAKDK